MLTEVSNEFSSKDNLFSFRNNYIVFLSKIGRRSRHNVDSRVGLEYSNTYIPTRICSIKGTLIEHFFLKQMNKSPIGKFLYLNSTSIMIYFFITSMFFRKFSKLQRQEKLINENSNKDLPLINFKKVYQNYVF